MITKKASHKWCAFALTEALALIAFAAALLLPASSACAQVQQDAVNNASAQTQQHAVNGALAQVQQYAVSGAATGGWPAGNFSANGTYTYLGMTSVFSSIAEPCWALLIPPAEPPSLPQTYWFIMYEGDPVDGCWYIGSGVIFHGEIIREDFVPYYCAAESGDSQADIIGPWVIIPNRGGWETFGPPPSVKIP